VTPNNPILNGQESLRSAPRSSKAEIQLRVDQTVTLILEGKATRDIVRYGSQNWGLSRRQIEKYIAVATRRIEQAGDRKTSLAYGMAVARLERLFNLSLNGAEIQNAIQVLKELHKLQGLHKIERSEQSPEEFARRLWIQMQQMEAVTLGKCIQCLGSGCNSCNRLSGGEIQALPESNSLFVNK
jgi:hypothetical protein